MLMAKPSPEMQSGSRGSEQRSSSAKQNLLHIVKAIRRRFNKEPLLNLYEGEPAKQDSKEEQAREGSKGEPAQKSPHQARKGSDEPSLSTENDEVDIKAKPRKRRSFLGFEKRKPGRTPRKESPKTAILRIDSRIEPVKRDSREEEELPKQDSKGEPAKQDSKEAQAREDSKGEPAQKSPHQARKGSDEPSLSTENDEVDIKAKPRKRRSFLGFEKRKPGRTPRKESELHTMQENTHGSNYVESENPS
ncbi:hypothetical protein TELCIR_13429 [Teladorsagia circumcincta]|uniref:Uncharacterized protein n=1 Tax=Teladorsagia circumcincta TaxID=45464 RepID=A0A2G9U3V9_TELCI|nr:hypothetical protein TELCIR_13429 [Teladorsagia circumcincta]